MPRIVRNLKFILIGLFVVKIIGTLFYLAGVSNIGDMIFSHQAAIAQDEHEYKKDDTRQEGVPESSNVDQASEKIRITLDGLEAKRIQLQKKEEELKQKEAQLTKLKQDMEGQIELLSRVHKKIEADLARMEAIETEEDRLKREKEEARMKQLVKVYSSMNPKRAGEILNTMDIDVALEIFMRIKGEKAGKILSKLTTQRAVMISERLAEKNTELKKK